MKHNKLVRDKIPEIIRQRNEKPITHTAYNEEYWQKLKEKLTEEVNEFLKDEKKEELADIMEVVYAICEYKQMDKKEIECLRTEKAKKLGGFKKRIILDEVK